MSLHLQTEAGALPAQVEVLEVGGAAYMRAAAGQRWTRSATPPPDPTWRSGADPQLVGQDRVDGVRTWHLRASRGRSPLDMWVRISDGYPLRVVTANGAGATFTFAFDRFNTGGRLLPPPAVEVKPAPRTLSGHVGDPLTLGGARITVLSFDGDAQPAEDAAGPRPGNRFVVVEVTVENVGGDALSTFLDWRLTDAAGYAWMEALSVREPSFPGGELAPGDASRGYLTYEVSRSSSRLTLSVKLDDDTASFGLG